MLEVEHLRAGYGDVVVLHGVDVAVPAGAVVALLGPNGAGKTTLLRAITGLLRPVAGQVMLDGQQVTGSAPDELARLGVCHVPEGRGVFPSLTVRENVVLQSKPGGERDALERASQAFPRLGERLNQVAGTMSGGEQQMLALARAYVCEPRFVLLDEVSLGLAPKIVDEIFSFLTQLVTAGVALLLVEQYVFRALELADYVYILERGRVEFAGEPSELEDGDMFERYIGGAAHGA